MRRGTSLVGLTYRLLSGLSVGVWRLTSLPQSNFTDDASTPPRQIPLFFLAGVFLWAVHLLQGPTVHAPGLSR